MIQIVGNQLTQWDVGRVAQVTGEATHVHIANQGDSRAVIMEIVGGEVKIPDYLLQTGKTLLAYAVLDGVTLESKAFAVRKRERPENYIYEDDQRNYIYKLIDDANEAIKNANDAAEELREAIKNGDIVIPEGGADSLIVTYEGDQASHTSEQIHDYVVSGCSVYLIVDGILYVSLTDVDYGCALFTDSRGINYSIDMEGRVWTYQETDKKNTMFVSVPNGEQADHLPSQMLSHIRAGGAVMLEVDGYFVNLSHCDGYYAVFAQICDDFVHYVHSIDPDGNYVIYEMPHASNEHLGDIESALDAIITMQEELIGT